MLSKNLVIQSSFLNEIDGINIEISIGKAVLLGQKASTGIPIGVK
jgi:hypothetical protein